MPNLRLEHSGNMNITSAEITSAGTLNVSYGPNNDVLVTGFSFTLPDTEFVCGGTYTITGTPIYSGTVLTENFVVSGVDVAGVNRSDTCTLNQKYNTDLYDLIYKFESRVPVLDAEVTDIRLHITSVELDITITGTTSGYVDFLYRNEIDRETVHSSSFYIDISQSGPTPATSLTINVADEIIMNGRATATYTPTVAIVNLVYSSSDTSKATIDPQTGFITVLQDGVVTFCVEDTMSGLEDCKEVSVYATPPAPPETGITYIEIIVDDYVITGDYARASYVPSTATVDLHYYSEVPEIVSIDETTGEITVLGTGVVTICVVDMLSGLSSCKSVNAASSGFIYVTYNVTSTTEPTQIMASIDPVNTYGLAGAYYNDNPITISTGYTFSTKGEHTIAYEVKNVGPFNMGYWRPTYTPGQERFQDIQTKYTWAGLDDIVKVVYDENMRYSGWGPFSGCTNLKYVVLLSEEPLLVPFRRTSVDTQSTSSYGYIQGTPWTLSLKPHHYDDEAIPIVVNPQTKWEYENKIPNWYYDARTDDWGDGYWSHFGGVIESCYGWNTDMYYRLWETNDPLLLSTGTDQTFITSIELTIPATITGLTETSQVSWSSSGETDRGFSGVAYSNGVYPIVDTPFLQSDRLKKDFAYTSSNPSVATIDEDGVITVLSTSSTYSVQFCVEEQYTEYSSCKNTLITPDMDSFFIATYNSTTTASTTTIINSAAAQYIDYAVYNGNTYEPSQLTSFKFAETGLQTVYFALKKGNFEFKGNTYVGPTGLVVRSVSALRKAVVPEDWGIIPAGFFRGSGVKEVDLKNVLAICDSAFHSSNLETINMPNVEIIDIYAFEYTKVKEMTIPSSVTFMENVLYDMHYLRNITFEGTNPPSLGSVSSLRNIMNIWVPCESVNAYKTALGNYSDFVKCLNNVNPDVVTATYHMTGTTISLIKASPAILSITDFNGNELMFPTGSNDWGEHTFPSTGDTVVFLTVDTNYVNANGFGNMFTAPNSWGTGLKELEIPESITNIDNTTFSGCTALETVMLPNTITSTTLGQKFMYGCTNVTGFTIPSSVTAISANAFTECIKLFGALSIPNIRSIGNGAFSYCNSLTSVVFGNDLEDIGASAFSYDTGLTVVSIPSGVTSIGTDGFFFCQNLKTMYFEGVTPPTLGEYALPCNHYKYGQTVYVTPYIENVYVPCQSVEAYKSGTGWDRWKDYVSCLT